MLKLPTWPTYWSMIYNSKGKIQTKQMSKLKKTDILCRSLASKFI